MAIEEDFIEVNGKLVKKYHDNVTNTSGTDDKLRKRKLIEEGRGDIYDLTAQSLQWCGLLTSVIGHIYGALSEEQKATIAPESKYIIDNALQLYQNTETTTDVKLQEDGLDFIKDLINNENKTAKIIKSK